MKTVAIIGGGASGLVASIFAKNEKNHVMILEKENSCAKKILVTGNGKCNYWNSDQRLCHYHSTREDILSKIETEQNQKKVLSFLDKIGIVPRIVNGYYYPYSKTATAMKEALLREIEDKKIEQKNNWEVIKCHKEKDKFILENQNGEKLEIDQVVLSTGSKAYYKNTNDFGYRLAKEFGHTMVEVLPSLVQLRAEGTYWKDWAGIKCEGTVELIIDGKKEKEEKGEIQLTEYGVSGICIFNLSGLAAKALNQKKKVQIHINWLDDLIKTTDTEKAKEFFSLRTEKMPGRTLEGILEGILHYKLLHVIFKKCNIEKEAKWQELSEEEKNILCESLQSFSLDITATNSFDRAQVCSGGVSLQEINPKTMESFLVPSLYITGELLDVDGDCGGYNLGFAFLSGMLAGLEIGEKND